MWSLPSGISMLYFNHSNIQHVMLMTPFFCQIQQEVPVSRKIIYNELKRFTLRVDMVPRGKFYCELV